MAQAKPGTAPDADNLDQMAEWFAQCKVYAEENDLPDMRRDAIFGLFFSNIEERVVEYRRKLTAELSVVPSGN